jgi:hypothetical protein
MLNIEQDDQRGTVTVEGVVYAQELLRDLAHALPIGQTFSLVKREDGVLTVRRHHAATALQALEALDELEASARGDEPFNHFAAPLIRQFIESTLGVMVSIPAGFKLAPINPTHAMKEAFDLAGVHEDDTIGFARAYAAMLDAAPDPASEPTP